MGFPSFPSVVPGYNGLSYRIAEQVVWQSYRSTIQRWRQAALGLDKGSFFGPFGHEQLPAAPVLNGFSGHVVPRPRDWGQHVHVTGYWLADDERWQPPDQLVDYLGAGPEPIFVGFGSMPVREPVRLVRLILEALKLSGQRCILSPGVAGMLKQDLPGTVYLLDYAPFTWLFKHVSAVVHHGGSGTTAAGLRAGRPTVIVPFVFDQFYWGRRVSELGAGPEPIPFKSLSAESLAKAMAAAVQEQRFRERGRELGSLISKEHGIASAVHIIESHYG